MKRASVGHVEELWHATEIAAISDEPSPSQPDNTPPSQLNVNLKLTATERRQLTEFLAEYSDNFGTTSKVRLTGVAIHRIVTKNYALPLHPSPFRVSLKAREVIQQQVQEMLDDEINQPSGSP